MISLIEVLYRDKQLIAVSKPAGLAVHRGWCNDDQTVHDIVRDKIIGMPIHALHRLDRATSGVLLFALDPTTARAINEQLEKGLAEKRYLALVRGPMKEHCLLDYAIPQTKDGPRVAAVTEFFPLVHRDRFTLVEARPKTGRLHQIRRHLKHLSHPIVGDVRYGRGDINRIFRDQYGWHRMALHATEITIEHPQGEKLTIEAPLPAEMLQFFERFGLPAWQ
ncbi:MAG TPA: pseudouridine synthase [Chroococcales cyanobacterium]